MISIWTNSSFPKPHRVYCCRKETGIRLAAPCLLALAPFISGCLAKTAFDVVTLPVKATSAAVDAVTTSQSEADEKRGREIRKREERLGKLDRRYQHESEQCAQGHISACNDAQATYAEMQELRTQIPAEPAA